MELEFELGTGDAAAGQGNKIKRLLALGFWFSCVF